MATTTSSIGPARKFDNRTEYDVHVFGGTIVTTVTTCSAAVTAWIGQVVNPKQKRGPIIGLDTVPNPSTEPTNRNPIATIQLCVGHRCLIYQKLGSEVPRSLVDLLEDRRNVFVGVGITSILKNLVNDWGAGGNAFSRELGSLAASHFPKLWLQYSSLKNLGIILMWKGFEKPLLSTMSPVWDEVELTSEQVLYASIDPFVSAEIGSYLCANLEPER